MFHRERPEKEYQYVIRFFKLFFRKLTVHSSRGLYKKYGLGTTTFSSLASGLLTGKVGNSSFPFAVNRDIGLNVYSSTMTGSLRAPGLPTVPP